MIGIMEPGEMSICRQIEQVCQAYGGQISCYFFDMVIFSPEQIARVGIKR